ncbi:hypothetical protein HGM15179_001360 [Zosterops borbonicus]|uniref:Uncharacterized protein n=1 Tax=Zosterops borbonicus TaxID=364589 RepID=A0A8K1LTJ2_9PASS|nr:hypothetical protein HGM15179_001360 [Zosterops borbonicus]
MKVFVIPQEEAADVMGEQRTLKSGLLASVMDYQFSITSCKKQYLAQEARTETLPQQMRIDLEAESINV